MNRLVHERLPSLKNNDIAAFALSISNYGWTGRRLVTDCIRKVEEEKRKKEEKRKESNNAMQRAQEMVKKMTVDEKLSLV